MKTLLTLGLLTCIFNVVYAQNKDIESTADIKSVTIYNASAEINYTKELQLPQGRVTVIFTELTPFIVENTINISTNNPDVEIITVTDKINYTKERKEQNSKIISLRDSIKHFENEIGLLKCKSDALNMEKSLLFKDESIGGVAKGVSVAEIEKASAFFSKRYYELTSELYHLNEKEKQLQSKLQMYQSQIVQLSANTTKSCSEIQLTVLNKALQKVVFNFKFLTAKGGWAPAYDCKYQGADKPINFVFRANVYNATGTDWNNIDIKLSTATPTQGFDKPSLGNKKPNVQATKPKADGNIQFREIIASNTIAEYDIKHKYTIPSDSKPYLIDVAAYDFNADYNYLLIPSIDPFGFLIAKIADWNKYNLISGTTNIYNKGSFMGKTFLNTYTENDTLSIYLGKDNNIQAVRKETGSSILNTLIGNYYVDKSEISIAVKNNTKEKFNIQLLEQVPIFVTQEKIKFNIVNIDQAFYDKTEGMLTWQFELDPNGNKLIEYRYELRVPKNDIGNYIPVQRKVRAINCPSF